MYFKSIELKNFRNYSSLKLDFNKKLNIFYGNNAQGKTNLIESIFITGMGKSFRTTSDKEMISFGSDYSKVKAEIIDDDHEDEVEIIYKKEGKIIKLDGVKLQRTIDLLETVYIVVFSPEDLKIVKEGPDNRRKFLDRELCQLKPVYYSDLGNYKKLLRERNSLLRNENRDKNLYSVFDESIADYALRIVKERKAFIERLQIISKEIHENISCRTEELELSYETKITNKENYLRILNENFEKDIQRGYTSFGPHKDDIKISVNNIDIRIFGSQGQQRTSALSIKLAELNLIKQETGKNAVLLLDDVLSELDINRQKYLISAMEDIQVFLTSAEMNSELENLLPKGTKYYVDKGNITIID